jgi:hypothetical protein
VVFEFRVKNLELPEASEPEFFESETVAGALHVLALVLYADQAESRAVFQAVRAVLEESLNADQAVFTAVLTALFPVVKAYAAESAVARALYAELSDWVYAVIPEPKACSLVFTAVPTQATMVEVLGVVVWANAGSTIVPSNPALNPRTVSVFLIVIFINFINKLILYTIRKDSLVHHMVCIASFCSVV